MSAIICNTSYYPITQTVRYECVINITERAMMMPSTKNNGPVTQSYAMLHLTLIVGESCMYL